MDASTHREMPIDAVSFDLDCEDLGEISQRSSSSDKTARWPFASVNARVGKTVPLVNSSAPFYNSQFLPSISAGKRPSAPCLRNRRYIAPPHRQSPAAAQSPVPADFPRDVRKITTPRAA